MVGWEPGVIESCSLPRTGVVAGLAGGREVCRRVVRVRGALVFGPVAGIAVGRHGRVVVVDVAAGANHAGMFAGEGKCGVVVIKRRGNPRRGVVANLALLGESGLHVVWTRGSIEILQMARRTTGVSEVVVSVQVALRALHRGVCPG